MLKTYALANGDKYDPFAEVDFTGTSGVYVVRCEATGTTYVGASGDIETRFGQHRELLCRGKHYNKALQADWNFYGEGAFTFEMIEYVKDLRALVVREQFWIEKVGTANRQPANRGKCPGTSRLPDSRT